MQGAGLGCRVQCMVGWVFIQVLASKVNARTLPNEKMPEVLFPKEWWKMAQEDYNEAKLKLKGLVAKEDGTGNGEVDSLKNFYVLCLHVKADDSGSLEFFRLT